MSSRPHVVPAAERLSLRDLELVAKRTMEGLRQGLHGSPFHGFSAEFNQYRHYRQGDDLKYVDWRVFGRSDRFYTRQFRETTNAAALFVLDVSRSMDFPAGEKSKFALAQSVVAALATLVVDQGDAAGLLTAADGVHYVAPRSGHHHLRLLLSATAKLTPAGASSVAIAMRQATTLLKRRGLVIVVSDLYEDAESLAELKRLSRMGHDVIVIHALAREEIDLDVRGAAELTDLETGRSLVVDAASERARYGAAVRRWLDDVQAAITREGLDYIRLVTGDPLAPALRRFLINRRGAR